MGTENIKKAIRQGLESSSLNESFMDKVKSLVGLKKIIREGFEIHKTDKECEYCGGTITHLEVRPEKNDYISACDDCGAKESEVDSNVEEGSARSQTNFRGKNKKPANYPWVKK